MIKNRGMRHLALKVSDVERAKDFYVRVFGMKLVWQPDADNSISSRHGCSSFGRGMQRKSACSIGSIARR